MSETNTTPAIVWSLTNCGYCNSAKQLLADNGIAFEERNLSEGVWTKEQLLEQVPNAVTVPQIFIGGKHIGGINELRVLIGAN